MPAGTFCRIQARQAALTDSDWKISKLKRSKNMEIINNVFGDMPQKTTY